MITQNAYDFLKTAVTSQYALTHHAPDDMPAHARTFRLWIDAICINQKDTPERNAQVEMMAQIYQSAKSVFVWLGPGGWFTQSAAKALQSIIEILKKHPQRSPISFTDISIFNTAWWKSQMIPEPGDWIGLYVFLQHAWFHRSWIVQEVALSGRATLFCGPFQMRFEILSACITFLIRSGWLAQMEKVGRYCVQGTTFFGHADRYLSQILAHNNVDARDYQPPEWAKTQLVVPGGKLQDLSTFLGPIMTIAGFGKSIKQRGKVDTDAHASILRNVLEICRNFDATVPHDKIFAFLSIAEEALKEPRAAPDRPIKIAYEKTADEVFTEVTGYLLASSKHMMDRQSEVLWQVEDKTARKISTLPSWVPDFSVECFPALIQDKVSHDWNCWPLKGRPDKDLVIDGRFLHAYGVMIDEVADVASLEGDRFKGSAKVALGLPAMYRCIGKDMNENVERDTEEAPQDEIANLLDMILEEPSIRVQHNWHVQIGQLKNNPTGDISESQSARTMYRDQLRPPRTATPLVSSPRRQTRIEAFWRTLLLDHCFDESPAPIEAGFALGDMIADRIHEKQVLHLLFRDEGTLNDLKDELALWQELASKEPKVVDTTLFWPSCGTTADEALMKYTEVESLACVFLSAYRDLEYPGMTPQQYSADEIQQLAVYACGEAIKLPPIRFLPKAGQFPLYILSNGRITKGEVESKRNADAGPQTKPQNDPEIEVDDVMDQLANAGIEVHELSPEMSSIVDKAFEPRPEEFEPRQEKPKKSSNFSFLNSRKHEKSGDRSSKGLKGWLHRSSGSASTTSQGAASQGSALSPSSQEPPSSSPPAPVQPPPLPMPDSTGKGKAIANSDDVQVNANTDPSTATIPKANPEKDTNTDPAIDDIYASVAPSPEAEQIRRTRQVNFFKQYHECAPGRRIFRTEKGWLGYGHESARAGDEVWFLTRCTAPFILRPCHTDGDSSKEGKRYEMVGVCYVHGLMNREDSQSEWMRVEEDLCIV